MKNLSKLGKTLNKNEQKSINGGNSTCVIPENACIACFGYPLPCNDCLGPPSTHACLNDEFGITC